MKSSIRKSCWRGVLEDGEALAAHVLLRGRDPQVGDGSHGLSTERSVGYCIGRLSNMERVVFHVAEVFGQNARLSRTEPCRSPTRTSPALAWSAMHQSCHRQSACRGGSRHRAGRRAAGKSKL